MVKKVEKIEYELFINGKPASLEQIAKRGGRKTWKSFLEATKLHHSESGDHYLREKLGEYRSSTYLRTNIGIDSLTLEKLRKKRVVKAEKLKGRWYYSVESLNEALKIVIK